MQAPALKHPAPGGRVDVHASCACGWRSPRTVDEADAAKAIQDRREEAKAHYMACRQELALRGHYDETPA